MVPIKLSGDQEATAQLYISKIVEQQKEVQALTDRLLRVILGLMGVVNENANKFSIAVLEDGIYLYDQETHELVDGEIKLRSVE